ncbi:MAG: YcxB family protein [Prevotella sp.]|jgi:hypothetical protein|nr:YcxB family protein [Prevotella sp.]
MELNYSLSEKDFLNFQLYYASQSDKFLSQRNRDRIRLPGLSLLFGVVLLFDDRSSVWAYILIISSFLFFILYKWWSAWFYKRFYKRQVKENMKDDLPYLIKLFLDNDVIEIDSKKGHRRLNVRDIEYISETAEYFYIIINQIYIIIPRSQISQIKIFRDQLEKYKEDSRIPYLKKLDWKWK